MTNDSSALQVLEDFRSFFDRVQKNGETVYAFASDLRSKHQRLEKSGCELGMMFLKMQLVRGVLEGAYGTHPSIAYFRTKMIHGDLKIRDIKFEEFVTKVHRVMYGAGLMVNGAVAKILPASAMAPRADGGQAAYEDEDSWFGQTCLDEQMVAACFAKWKCPVCRFPRNHPKDHDMTKCPALKARGYIVTYNPENDQYRTKEQREAMLAKYKAQLSTKDLSTLYCA